MLSDTGLYLIESMNDCLETIPPCFAVTKEATASVSSDGLVAMTRVNGPVEGILLICCRQALTVLLRNNIDKPCPSNSTPSVMTKPLGFKKAVTSIVFCSLNTTTSKSPAFGSLTSIRPGHSFRSSDHLSDVSLESIEGEYGVRL